MSYIDKEGILHADAEPVGIVTLALLLGACGLAIVLVLVMATGLDRLAKLERAAQAAEAAAKSRVPLGGCDEPRKTGDRAVIIVRREGAKLAIECNPLLDWREPMRSLKK